MPYFQRGSRVQQVFVQSQTFENFIVIRDETGNSIKVRPFQRRASNGRVTMGWEQEYQGQWIVTNDKEFR